MPLWDRSIRFLTLLVPGLAACGTSWNIQDGDGDGVSAAQGDCWDQEEGPAGSGLSGAEIGPNQEESWYDGFDQDCAGDDDYDADNDGFVPEEFVGISTYQVTGSGQLPGGDCWDNPVEQTVEYTVTSDTMYTGGSYPEIAAIEVNPDAEDRWYDGVDQDCGGNDDFDQDNDGYRSAFHEDQFGASGDDCIDGSQLDDENPAETDADDVYPGAEEIWYDGTDQDCDTNDCDQDGDGFWYDGLDLGYCADDLEDCDDLDANQVPDETADEIFYNGIDDNCNVATGDEDGDIDGDGFWASDYDEQVEANEDAIDDPMDIPEGQDGDCWDDPDQRPEEMEALHDFDQPDADEVNPEAEDVYYDGIDQDCAGDDGDGDGVEDDFDWDGDGFATALYDNRDGDLGDDCIDCPDGYAGLPECLGEDPNPGDVNPVGINPDGNETYYDGTDQDCDDASDYDADEDGYGTWDEEYEDEIAEEGLVLTGDCDDIDDDIHPGADDDWYSGVDEDCDGRDDYDADEDGYVDDDYSGLETEYVDGSGALPDGDCDDTNDDANPGDTEDCDTSFDDDCDSDTNDEDADNCEVYYKDADGDTYGDPDLEKCMCEESGKYDVQNDDDCDDSNDNAYPGVAHADSATQCMEDDDGDGYGDENPSSSEIAEGTDCDDGEENANPGMQEDCGTTYDDDCDNDGDTNDVGAIDCIDYYMDDDEDSFGDPDDTQCTCTTDGDYDVTDDSDCDDDDDDTFPGSAENESSSACMTDADADGYGDSNAKGGVTDGDDCDDDDDDTYPGSGEKDSTTACTTDLDGDGWASDSPASGVTAGTDCDDSRSSVNTEGAEDCDTSYDDDCDNDDNDVGADNCTTYYLDSDGDGYGDASDSQCTCETDGNYDVTDDEDCDDTRSAVSPSGTETCNTTYDDDCDDDTNDIGATNCTTYYMDADGDGFGDADDSQCTCETDGDYDVTDDEDCDDARKKVNPDATEDCDTTYDDNCDEETNEVDADNCTTYYLDSDGDGFGDEDDSQCSCSGLDDYDVTDDEDCDDSRSAVNPDETEDCDTSYDDNCDDETDEINADNCIDYYVDADDDGLGDSTDSQCTCDADSTYTVTTGGDCDDDCYACVEGSTSTLLDDDGDGSDGDCDGYIDEDYVIDTILGGGDDVLVITEFLPMAMGGLGEDEWFEVYNASSETLYLNGWEFERRNHGGAGSQSFFISSDAELSVDAGRYLVFCADSSAIVNVSCDYEYLVDNGLGSSVWGESYDTSFTLTNTGGEILIYLESTTLDEVEWDTTLSTDPWSVTEGFSLELATPMYNSTDNDDSTNWCENTTDEYDTTNGNFGTPGSVNSCP